MEDVKNVHQRREQPGREEGSKQRGTGQTAVRKVGREGGNRPWKIVQNGGGAKRPGKERKRGSP